MKNKLIALLCLGILIASAIAFAVPSPISVYINVLDSEGGVATSKKLTISYTTEVNGGDPVSKQIDTVNDLDVSSGPIYHWGASGGDSAVMFANIVIKAGTDVVITVDDYQDYTFENVDNDIDDNGEPLDITLQEELSCNDNDVDGYGVCPDCGIANGCTYDGNDCDDAEGDVNPGESELCNGVDDDCDTATDEDFSELGDSCTAGTGACEASGNYVCKGDGTGTECDATPGAPAANDKTCNGIDEDCDGTADEDYVQDTSCFLPGACAAENTASSCIAGVETACSTGTPGTEVCDGSKDEDCDGSVDEDCECTDGDTKQCGTTDVGACEYGTQTCSGGTWGDCIGSIEPADNDDTCDGVDDDCDGTADQDYEETATTCGIGACEAEGLMQCIDGKEEDSCTEGTPAADDKTCNGIDEDCDGTADEDYVQDTSCFLQGICSNDNAASSCTDGVETACSTGTPGTEVCDGSKDEDCDGSVDEDCECTNGDTKQCGTTDVGACEYGSQTCSDGVWGDCIGKIEPAADDKTCNGIDEDCDGSEDEDYVQDASCFLPGICSNDNTASSCTDGVETACSTGTPETEVCDGTKDEDCDGSTDEDCECTNGDTKQCGETDVGACEYGTQTCSGGTWGDCIGSIEPADNDDTCDGIDEDCDGTADQDYEETATTCGIGACEADGLMQCINGKEEDSCTEGTPEIEDDTCDGIDEDCDGTADEDYEETATTCGTGVCEANGLLQCINGHEKDSCSPGTGDYEECDNLDNDCDGTVDEDLTKDTICGVGACSGNMGYVTCTAGEWGDNTCDPFEGATPEVCDEGPVDEDCDGTKNEDCICTNGNIQQCGTTDVGACEYGTQTCSDGKWGDCIGSVEPANDATCDGIDEDCDGDADEGLTQSCGTGKCAGTKTCTSGEWGECSSQGKDAGVCALCGSDGNPAYDETQDNDCSCPSDSCTDADGDSIIDDHTDYPEGECQSVDTCSSCSKSTTNNDERCKTSMKVGIDKGISIFSLPLMPESPVTFNDIQEGCAFPDGITTGIAYWDPQMGGSGMKYVYLSMDSRLYPGQGYFTIQNNNCEFIIEGYRFDIGKVGYLGTNNLYDGWNIIGAPSGETINDFDNVEGACSVVSGPWGRSAAQNQYVRTQKLVPGRGYFVKTTNDCSLG
ncbi:hypothetical protein KY366_04205 [Candidatus Woesearchaeota archaeon]|nr:hypothetical protein [Candidatus Woesearchaeota archaeon]